MLAGCLCPSGIISFKRKKRCFHQPSTTTLIYVLRAFATLLVVLTNDTVAPSSAKSNGPISFQSSALRISQSDENSSARVPLSRRRRTGTDIFDVVESFANGPVIPCIKDPGRMGLVVFSAIFRNISPAIGLDISEQQQS